VTHDLIIIGTGPAGLAAGSHAGRSGLDTLYLEKDSVGGELVNRHDVRWFPGFPDGISGTDLRQRMVEGAERYDPEVTLATVEGIDPGEGDEPHAVRTENSTYETEAVIVATGGEEAELGVPGEDEYEGRGVFYCSACDGPLYRDDRVAVVGGDNRAVVDAIYLTEFAAEVVLFTEADDLDADAAIREEAADTEDLEIRRGTRVAEVLGTDGLVDGIRIVDPSGDEETVAVDGVNVNVGSEPNTGFVADTLELTDEDLVVVDQKMETSVPGIFAAGDVREDSPLEIAAAVGDGITAVEAAKRSL